MVTGFSVIRVSSISQYLCCVQNSFDSLEWTDCCRSRLSLVHMDDGRVNRPFAEITSSEKCSKTKYSVEDLSTSGDSLHFR